MASRHSSSTALSSSEVMNRRNAFTNTVRALSVLRALASVVVGIATVVGIVVYEHYSIDEPPSDSFTAAVATAAALLTWLVTALD